jgi:hypothetical protein
MATGPWLVNQKRRLVAAALLSALGACRATAPIGSQLADSATPTPASQAAVLAQKLFFHWAGTRANSSLLTAGGYPAAASHAAVLSTGDAATVTRPVMDIARGWFVQHPVGDTAGAGIYLAPNPMNSAGYGADLLVFRVESANGGFATINDQTRYKGVRVPDIDAGAFDQFPAITRYYPLPLAWMVVSREPKAGEDLQIHFAPPAAADAAGAWAAETAGSKTTTDVLVDLRDLGKLLLAQADDPRPKTPASLQFLQLILTGPGYDYVKGLGDLTALSDDEADSIATFRFAATRGAPDDPRAADLATWQLPPMPKFFFSSETRAFHEQLLAASGYSLPATGHVYDQWRTADQAPVDLSPDAFTMLATKSGEALAGHAQVNVMPLGGDNLLVIRATRRQSDAGLPWTRDPASFSSKTPLPPPTDGNLSYTMLEGELSLFKIPGPDEDVRFTIAPLAASDVDDAWDQISRGRDRAQVISVMGTIIQFSLSAMKAQSMTKATHDFLQGLIFAKFAAYLTALNQPQDLSPGESNDLVNMQGDLSSDAPNDPLTAYLQSWPNLKRASDFQ